MARRTGKNKDEPGASSGDRVEKVEVRVEKVEDRADATETKADKSEVRSDKIEVKADKNDARADVSDRRADLSERRADVSERRADVSDSRADQIEGGFIDLLEELGGIRGDLQATNKELVRVKRSKVRDRIIFGLFAILAVGVMFTNWNSNQHDKDTLNAVKAQGIAGVVSNCAFTNLQSIAISEMLIDFERSGLVPRNADADTFFEKERSRFQKVDCVGLVSESGKELSICLQYPPQTDPKTGLPIPTTTTPEDKEACDKAAENARKSAELQEKQLKEKEKNK